MVGLVRAAMVAEEEFLKFSFCRPCREKSKPQRRMNLRDPSSILQRIVSMNIVYRYNIHTYILLQCVMRIAGCNNGKVLSSQAGFEQCYSRTSTAKHKSHQTCAHHQLSEKDALSSRIFPSLFRCSYDIVDVQTLEIPSLALKG